MNFQERANALIDAGFSVIPLGPKSKQVIVNEAGVPIGPGAISRTRDKKMVEYWASKWPDANAALCADENFTMVETDSEKELREKIRVMTGHEMPLTLRIGANPNRCYWVFRRTPACGLAVKGEGEGYNPKVGELLEFRNRNFYCAGPGSLHKKGAEYKILDDYPPIPIPDWLVAAIEELSEAYKGNRTSEFQKPGDAAALSKRYKDGGRKLEAIFGSGLTFAGDHDTLVSVLAFIHNGRRDREELFDALNRLRAENCHDPQDIPDKELYDMIDHAMDGKRKPSKGPDRTVGLRIFPDLPEFDEPYEEALKEKLLEDHKKKEAAPQPTVPPFHPQSLVDFMAENYPEPEPLVEGVLYLGDFTSLTGRRRNGKTTLLHNLALAGASGDQSYLDLKITRPFKTLAFYFEDDPGDMQAKLRKMLAGREANDRFHLYTKLDFRRWELVMDVMDSAFKNRIIECCAAHNPDWITFDNLGILIGADYNNAKAIHELVKFVWDLQSRFRCAVTVAAHPRKQSSDLIETLSLIKNPGRFFEECMGSSHFINSTGAMWGVERDEDDRTHLVLGSQRVTGDYTVTVAEKDDNHWLHAVQDMSVAVHTLLNTPKRQEAWGKLPDTFTYQVALEAQQPSLSLAAFKKWWGSLKRTQMLVPLVNSPKMFKKSPSATITIE